jgi:hypothetical protein
MKDATDQKFKDILEIIKKSKREHAIDEQQITNPSNNTNK